APDLEGWEVPHNAKPGEPLVLRVRLRQALFEGSVQIRCLGPVPQGRWVSPGVRLREAVGRGEALELHLHPEVRLLDWDPGSFRLADVGAVSEPDFFFTLPAPGAPLHGGVRRLSLLGGGIARAGDAAPRRPSATLQSDGVEYRAGQRTWWQLQA